MKQLLLFLTAGLFAIGCAAPSSDPPVPTAGTQSMEPVGPPRTELLTPGTPFPPLQAAGWVNGPPPAFDSPGVRGIVVDLWALWCPYCREAAPELVKLQSQYEPQGILFVSLTNMSRTTVESYVQQFGITWPNGYGASISTFAAYGAYHNAVLVPGYEVTPTIYLLNPDGTVRWSDQRARFRHVKAADLAPELASQLDELLHDSLAPPLLGGS
jgi:thiol-disulfide isomerase/thioredoxin